MSIPTDLIAPVNPSIETTISFGKKTGILSGIWKLTKETGLAAFKYGVPLIMIYYSCVLLNDCYKWCRASTEQDRQAVFSHVVEILKVATVSGVALFAIDVTASVVFRVPRIGLPFCLFR